MKKLLAALVLCGLGAGIAAPASAKTIIIEHGHHHFHHFYHPFHHFHHHRTVIINR